jgi:transglutaminase-like putative cysteine protease
MPDLPPPASAENRCVFRVVSSANYRYGRSARGVHTFVRLFPPLQRGLQRMTDHQLRVAPLPQATPKTEDRWGNRVFEVRHDFVDEQLTLVAELTVETACRYGPNGEILPTPIAPRAQLYAERRLYREATDRTRPDDALAQLARDLSGPDIQDDPFQFAARVCAYVHAAMTFNSGSTHVGTPAAEAWAHRRGVCQDFTHVTLCLLRLNGIPARYVSGFVPGEGVMHAWVEAMLPPPENPDAGAWFAIDPTYNKWVTERYVTVAVGRDYGDVTPTSGTYFGGANTLHYGTRVDTVKSEIVLL